MSRVPAAVVVEIDLRSEGWCELTTDCIAHTGTDPDGRIFELHHRQARGMGGSRRDLDTARNIIRIHRACHRYCHAHPLWARERGYIVSQYSVTP